MIAALAITAHAENADALPGLAAQSSGFFYTGKPYNEELGAYIFNYRSYDAHLSRWTTADPSGFPDGANASKYVRAPMSQLDPNGLVTVTTSFVDLHIDSLMVGGAIGQFLGDFNLTINNSATHTIENVGARYRAVATAGAAFESLSPTMYLPAIGSVSSAPAGTVDATTYSQVRTHEAWHQMIYTTYIHQIYTAYETWSAGYTGSWFSDPGAAAGAFTTDQSNALALANSPDWQNLFNDAFGSHPTDAYVNGDQLWRVRNPDWGLSFAEGLAGSLNPNFRTQDGDE